MKGRSEDRTLIALFFIKKSSRFIDRILYLIV